MGHIGRFNIIFDKFIHFFTEKLSSLNSWWGISAMFLIQIFYELPTTILYLLSALDRPKVLHATINVNLKLNILILDCSFEH
jgi:hypothetical protein